MNEINNNHAIYDDFILYALLVLLQNDPEFFAEYRGNSFLRVLLYLELLLQ